MASGPALTVPRLSVEVLEGQAAGGGGRRSEERWPQEDRRFKGCSDRDGASRERIAALMGRQFCPEESHMPVTVKNIVLWRKEVENQPGILASTLEPFAAGGADLQVVMGYRFPGNETKAAIELYPVTGRQLTKAAEAAGLAASSLPALLVEGDNKPGLGHAIAQAIAGAGINIGFLVAQVIGRRYSAVIGFETPEDAKKAASLIKRITTVQKPRPRAGSRKK